MIPTTRRAANRESTIVVDVLLIFTGAIAGAVAGAFVGLSGMIAGVVVGSALAAVIARVWLREDRIWNARDRRLDHAIGVIGGSLGSANLKHPPPKVGAYSATSLGVTSSSGGGSSPAEGPMQSPD